MAIRNYQPNHAGIGQLLKGGEMRSLVRERTEMAEAIYRARVARRTGMLARDTRVSTFLGGPLNNMAKGDRWVGRLTVGLQQARVVYGASHEFGTDDGDEQIVAGAHDLPAVLAELRNI
ncbi:hypothetical protein BS297_17825 [Rhodococcus erythropolis]|uniref:HK97 gp10 family phage protein n=1 Tax=Rhodococcus erythropolis TaxID=1833 RepID=A0A0C3A290_RHOER|nr:hypothetical protein BS297_17825 [Rhodococcus erythropolis]KIM14389.1 hypothetical protein QV65_32415 [Rhodococcus erythropolis]